MSKYTNKYTMEYEVKKEEDPDAVPPPRPDLRALAQPYGAAYGDTGLISKLEPGKSEILNSRVGDKSFREFIFEPSSSQLFEQERSLGILGGDLVDFLFWKTAEQEARVPEFDEPGVRDKVLYAWRLRKARQMALAKARELAQEIPMGPEVREMENVRWAPSADLVWRIPLKRPAYSPEPDRQPRQIIAGPEFMRTVHELGWGEIGVAMDYPQKVAYVIRITRPGQTPEFLKRQFRKGWKAVVTQRMDRPTADFRDEYVATQRFDQQFMEVQEAWLEERRAEAELRWKRPPREIRRRE